MLIIIKEPVLPANFKNSYQLFLNDTDRSLPHIETALKKYPNDHLFDLVYYASYLGKLDISKYVAVMPKTKSEALRFDRTKLYNTVLSVVMKYKHEVVWPHEDDTRTLFGIQLGNLYQIQYMRYEQDPYPLALFINDFDSMHSNFFAFNLHYVRPKVRFHILQSLYAFNKNRINSNQAPIVMASFIYKIAPEARMALRQYKVGYIKMIEKVSPNRWLEYVKIDERSIYGKVGRQPINMDSISAIE